VGVLSCAEVKGKSKKKGKGEFEAGENLKVFKKSLLNSHLRVKMTAKIIKTERSFLKFHPELLSASKSRLQPTIIH
jgi:hypothetical protein